MRKLLFILVFLSFGSKTFSQVLSDYAFNAFSSTYAPVSGSFIGSSGGTGWGSTIYDDCFYNSIPIGFNFVYCGTTYTSLSASQNCWITLGQTFTGFTNTYDCDLSNTTTGGFGAFNLPRPIIAALWLDVIVTSNNVRYATTGSAPNRVFTIEWSNCGLYPSTTSAETVEIILYETTNIIDFAYTNISSGSTGTGHLSIGITDGSGSAVAGSVNYWSLNSTGSSPAVSMTTESKFLTGLPATNQVYRWSPQCVGTPVAGTVSATITTSCSPYSSTLSLSGASSTLGITYQWQSAPSSSGTWTNISGATTTTYTASVSSTLWYRCVVTCTNSGISSATSPVQLVLNTPPASISGTGAICVGATTTLTSATSGGIWTSSSTGIATIGSSSGVVTGISPGTSTISYTLTTGCNATVVVSVLATPSAISGPATVCTGATITLTDAVGGGTWISSATGTATVGAASGVVSGVAPGVVTITYSLGLCSVTMPVTVNPSPSAISGPTAVCVGASITLTDPTSGGSWSSSNPLTATIGSSSGIVTGLSGGVTFITYILPGGCYAVKAILVNPNPSGIAGLPTVCVGQTNTLLGPGGGTWTSSNPFIATVGSTTGVVSGITIGTATITYTLPTTCFTIYSITVNPLPAPITGDANLCIGSMDTLTDATPGGIWSSGNPFTVSIDPSTGVDTGITSGTAAIFYTLSTGCAATIIVTVHPSPGSILGTPMVCVGNTALLVVGSGSGAWSSSNPAVATIGSLTGLVSGIAPGTSVIRYTLSSGCYTQTTVTVNPLPASISGLSAVCVGLSITLTDATPGGMFSSTSSFVSVTASGTVTGTAAGTALVTYTLLSTGCYVTHPVTVTTSSPISGPSQVCVGASISLTPTVGGGTWSSSNPSVATVGSTSSIITGASSGLTTITYSIGIGCFTTKIITVNPLPAVISGAGMVCIGTTITLTDASPGGTWLSSTPIIAAIGSSSGIVLGISGGSTVITYTLSTSCSITKTITVNTAPPAISGPGAVCIGSTITLTNPSVGGVWSISSISIATIGSSTGIVTGVASGVATVTYTIGSGCAISKNITVNPLPSLCSVYGGGSVCAGSPGLHVGLLCSSAGTSYQLYNGGTPVGSLIIGTGSSLDFGLQTTAGAYTVVATNPLTSCSRNMTGSVTITVNPLPAPISGPSAVCVSANITLIDASSGGTWVSSTPSVATIGSSSGIVNGITTGTTTITYTLSTGCAITTIVTVSPSPTAIIGPSTGCAFATVTLSDAISGGVWTSSTLSVATIGSLSGLLTGVAPGVTVITYSLGSGCTVNKTITINASPSPISGPAGICTGTTATYTDPTPGVIWGSLTPTVIVVGASSGIATGISAGSGIVICSLSITGCYVSKPVTVNPLPTPISGALQVCIGNTTVLTDGIPGGTWSSSSTGVATISATSGIVTGIVAGTTVITYSLGTGCIITTIVTVNPSPLPIVGTGQVCIGLTTALTDPSPGGTWSTTTPAVGTITTSGIVTGITLGPDTIVYTLPTTGCTAMKVVTVNPVPLPISGSVSVCAGQISPLTDATPGGTWTSGTPSIATISSSGMVMGVAAGTTIITYTAGGCYVTTIATVIASPASIIGPSTVCVGNNALQTIASAGGIWSSGNPSIASIGSGSGNVTGISSGTALIYYTLGSTGCTSVKAIAVNPIPPILGPDLVCVGQTILLTDTALGGSWSSGTPSIATVSGSGGVVTGMAAGTATITYTTIAVCIATKAITVNTIPPAITGFPYVCLGQTVALTNLFPGGTWSSSNTAVGSISSTGVVTGLAVGTTTISYTISTGCIRTVVVTVNGLPPAISGPGSVCIGALVTLTDPISGGTWTSSNPTVGTISSSGVVSGLTVGTTTISYTLGFGCSATKVLNVYAPPPAIIGSLQVCVSSTTSLSNPAIGGTWSSGSLSIATVDAFTGVVTGIIPGTATISYTLGCAITAVVTINPVPSAIVGSTNVCVGGTTILTDALPGGAWSSSSPAIGSISSSGLVLGISGGSTTISYTILATGCATSATVLVNPAPLPIAGSPNVCIGMTTALSDATPGGVWSSSNPSIAPVDVAGVVTGAALGSTIISYTLIGTTGCQTTLAVSVNPLPGAITGVGNVCQGSTITLSNTISGGTWTSSSPAIAIATASGATTGIITGINVGTAIITYSVGAGCYTTTSIVVNPIPAPIFGSNTVCATQSITLIDATSGGTWSSSIVATATIGSTTGIVTGVLAGTTLISYSNSLGCAATYPVTVNPMPSAIIGSANVCLTGTSILSDLAGGGIWISSNPAVATIGSSSGIVTGIALGTATIIYKLPGGCSVTKVINVYPLPVVFMVTGGGSHCAGDAGVHIGLTGSATGVNYLLYKGATAVGTYPGTGTALDFGLHTVAGIYTVTGTSVATGCSVNMAGSVFVSVIPSVVPIVNINASPNDTVCTGATAIFTPISINGGIAPVYNWSVNGFPVATGGSYTFIPSNGDVVSVTMTSNATCATPATATGNITMTVQPFGTPNISLALSPNDTVCQGTLVTAHTITAYAGNAPAYTWYKNGVIASYSGSSYSFVPNNGDELFCVLTSNHPCRLADKDSSAIVKETTVTPILPVVSITASPSTTVSKGQTVTLTATVIHAIMPTYQWYINGLPVVGATNATFINSTYSYLDQDSVSCAVTSHDVCEVTTHQWVYIRVVTEGVSQITKSANISILPNPNKGEFVIKGILDNVNDETLTLEITNMLGQTVRKQPVIVQGGKIYLEIVLDKTIANGMYILSLRSENFSNVFHIVVE